MHRAALHGNSYIVALIPNLHAGMIGVVQVDYM